ncbi:MAG: hypothetical protein IIC82_03280, partial [Chloroflexi bacterium]|nr:hypothetical protein [Chloroflexota bacterium]
MRFLKRSSETNVDDEPMSSDETLDLLGEFPTDKSSPTDEPPEEPAPQKGRVSRMSGMLRRFRKESDDDGGASADDESSDEQSELELLVAGLAEPADDHDSSPSRGQALLSMIRGLWDHVRQRAAQGDGRQFILDLKLGARETFRRAADGISSVFRGPVITVSMEGNQLKTVRVKRNKVVSWETATIERDPDTKGILVAQTAGDAGEPSTSYVPLAKWLRARGYRFITDVPFSGYLVRRVPVPYVQPRYMNDVVTTEVLESVPFRMADIDINWTLGRNGQGKEAVAVVIPKRSMDAHIEAIRRSGIKPRKAFSRADALVYGAGISDGIVANLQGDRLSLIVTQLKVPQVVSQISIPHENEGIEKQAKAIVKAIEQAASYGEGTESDASGMPVVVTGEFVQRTELYNEVLRLSERELREPSPQLQCPPEFPLGEYAVNVGLALADRANSPWAIPVTQHGWPTVDLLSERHRGTIVKPLPAATALLIASLLFGAY